MLKFRPFPLPVQSRALPTNSRSTLVDMGILDIVLMSLGAVSCRPLPSASNNRPIPTLNIHKVTNWFKMVGIGASTITTKMVKFKTLWNRPIKSFPKPEMAASSCPAISGVELGVTIMIERLSPTPAAILNNNNFPEFIPIREFVKPQSLDNINRAISLQSTSVHSAKTRLSSWFRTVMNRAGVMILVRHVDKCNSYAVPCQLIQT